MHYLTGILLMSVAAFLIIATDVNGLPSAVLQKINENHPQTGKFGENAAVAATDKDGKWRAIRSNSAFAHQMVSSNSLRQTPAKRAGGNVKEANLEEIIEAEQNPRSSLDQWQMERPLQRQQLTYPGSAAAGNQGEAEAEQEEDGQMLDEDENRDNNGEGLEVEDTMMGGSAAEAAAAATTDHEQEEEVVGNRAPFVTKSIDEYEKGYTYGVNRDELDRALENAILKAEMYAYHNKDNNDQYYGGGGSRRLRRGAVDSVPKFNRKVREVPLSPDDILTILELYEDSRRHQGHYYDDDNHSNGGGARGSNANPRYMYDTVINDAAAEDLDRTNNMMGNAPKNHRWQDEYLVGADAATRNTWPSHYHRNDAQGVLRNGEKRYLNGGGTLHRNDGPKRVATTNRKYGQINNGASSLLYKRLAM